MSRRATTFYRYRAFGTLTLDSLCEDTLYFADPGTFNDPLDCSPTVDCDSDVAQLRELLATLVRRRVSAEVLESLAKARIRRESATAHAAKRAQLEAAGELANVAYLATDPEYSLDQEKAEAWLLTEEIERELLRHYERGVCCFSTTCSSPLLWSHYGDQHKGLCLGYGVGREPKPELRPVVYGGDRSIKTSTLVQALLNEDRTAWDTLDRDVLLRKARGWSYEREWRLIGPQGLRDSPLLLKEVTFGLRCPPSVMHAVVEALSGRDAPVRFFEMFEVRGRYVLRRRPLDLAELARTLPRTAVSGVELFGPITETESNASARGINSVRR